MLALLREIIDWVGPAFAAAGYVLIGTAVALERSIFIGLVVPGDVVLALGGIYAARAELWLPAVIAVGIAAGAVGESAGYWLGRCHGEALIRRLPLVSRLDGRLEKAQRYFERHGGKTVAVGRYASAVGTFIPFSAGMARMPYARFLAFDLPSVAVWGTGIVLVGYFFGENLDLVERILSRFGWAMFAAVVVFFVGRWLWRRRRRSGDG